jgi:hypothetical protein
LVVVFVVLPGSWLPPINPNPIAFFVSADVVFCVCPPPFLQIDCCVDMLLLFDCELTLTVVLSSVQQQLFADMQWKIMVKVIGTKG